MSRRVMRSLPPPGELVSPGRESDAAGLDLNPRSPEAPWRNASCRRLALLHRRGKLAGVAWAFRLGAATLDEPVPVLDKGGRDYQRIWLQNM